MGNTWFSWLFRTVDLGYSTDVPVNCTWKSKDVNMPSCCFIFSFQYIVLLFLGKHVLYWSFDTLDNVILMQGNEQMDYDALVDGQVKCTVYLINLIIKLYSFIKTPHSKKSNLQRHGKGHDSTFNLTGVSWKLQRSRYISLSVTNVKITLLSKLKIMKVDKLYKHIFRLVLQWVQIILNNNGLILEFILRPAWLDQILVVQVVQRVCGIEWLNVLKILQSSQQEQPIPHQDLLFYAKAQPEPGKIFKL